MNNARIAHIAALETMMHAETNEARRERLAAKIVKLCARQHHA